MSPATPATPCAGADVLIVGAGGRVAARVGDGWADLARLAVQHRATHLLADAALPPERLRALRRVAHAAGARAGLVLREAPRSPASAWRATVAGHEVLLLPRGAGRPRAAAAKRAFDLALAPVLVALTLPVWLAAAVAIRLEGGGPVFFAHARAGRDGRPFRLWKFRTMRPGAPAYAPSPHDADPAVTRVGRVLRPTGLDELPQLLNVLRGDMHLVGPRPEMPGVAAGYTATERRRLAAAPGVTGLWQLLGDRARPMHAGLAYDLAYLAGESAAVDARLIAGTLAHALGALVRQLTARPAWRPAAATASGVRAPGDRRPAAR